MSSPWEREWIKTEEDNLGRPNDLKKKEEKARLGALPYKALSYLGLGQSAQDEAQPEEKRKLFKERQSEVLESLTDTELRALIEFVTWRQENVVAPQQK